MLRKTVYIIFLCILNIPATAQDTITRLLDENLAVVTSQRDASFSADIVKKNGVWEAVIYYGSGNVAATGSYKDKQLTTRHGWFTFFYSATGRRMYEVRYDNNYQNDTWRSWHENGRIKDSGRLYDGKKTGHWVTWYSNGKIAASGAYADADKLEVPGLEGLFKDEKRRVRAYYLSQQPDIRNGLWKMWYRNGQIKDSIFYLPNGDAEGVAKSWYENGNLESAGTYIRGKAGGTWEWFHPNTRHSTIEQYVNGKINSMQCFDTAGIRTGDFCSIDKPALFPGGPTAFEEYLKTNIHYPSRAGTQRGEVELDFIVNEQGRAQDVTVTYSPSNYFSQEAERLIYEMPKWEPAVSHNRLTTFPVSVKLAFRPKN